MGTMQTVNKDSNDFGEIRREGYVYVDKTASRLRVMKILTS